MGSGDFDENRVGVGHPTWVDPPVDVSLSGTAFPLRNRAEILTLKTRRNKKATVKISDF